jgi:histidyl-tRNA synthetase
LGSRGDYVIKVNNRKVLDGVMERGSGSIALSRERIADYQKMVKTLRDAGIRAELYLGNPKNFGNQLKYADRRNSPCVVIQGGDEQAKGEVQIKDLILGAKAAEEIASNEEWRKGRPAQFSVPEGELVQAVKDVLARHGIK